MVGGNRTAATGSPPPLMETRGEASMSAQRLFRQVYDCDCNVTKPQTFRKRLLMFLIYFLYLYSTFSSLG